MKILCKIGLSVLIAIGSLFSSVSHAATGQLWVGADKWGTSDESKATDVSPQEVTHLVIWNKDGSFMAIALDERPVLQFDEDEMLVKVTTSKQELSFSLQTVKKYTLGTDDDQTVTEATSPSMQDGQFSHQSDMLYFKGFKKKTVISIYSTDGMLISRHKTGDDGMASISTAEWVKGIYLVKTDSATYKIIKK